MRLMTGIIKQAIAKGSIDGAGIKMIGMRERAEKGPVM
jgi:hypothetical protein